MPVILLNGRGQLGSLIKKEIKNINLKNIVYIYHTWNIEDKSEMTQKKEYEKFKLFLDTAEKKSKIIFISTKSQQESWYVKYKQLSESYLTQNCQTSLVLRFPTLIGKGIFYDFKNNIKQPYGKMDIMSIEEACKIIIDNINYSGYLKSKSFKGHEIKAKIVYELVKL